MKLNCEKVKNGLIVELNNKKFHLSYPPKIWENYPKNLKDVLVDNLVHLLTINLPLVAGFKSLKYNTSFPSFQPLFREVVINSLPAVVEDYNIRTDDMIKKFQNINYEFRDFHVKKLSYNYDTEERAVVSSSCGKDSLLSLAVCKEIGLNPIGIYINDTVSPSENRIKKGFGRRLSKEVDIDFYIVENEIEKLNDFEFWNKNGGSIGYTHMVTGFCLMSLPFSYYFKGKYIVVGNQRDMEFSFYNKDGFLAYPSFDQTTTWTKKQNKIVKRMTNGKTEIISVIEPLTNLAIIRILHKRYAKFGKYQISCDSLDISNEKRWCQECNKCARLFIFMKANNIDVKRVGFKKNLLDKKYKNIYSLFGGNEIDSYEKSKEARDEQLLAFYMAYRNGIKGYLIDLFKKKFLKEAELREDDLIKEFFSVTKSFTIPKKIKKGVFGIYKEELKNIF